MVDALAQLEVSNVGEEESKAHGVSVRDEGTIPDAVTQRKLSGRAALMGKKRTDTDEDF